MNNITTMLYNLTFEGEDGAELAVVYDKPFWVAKIVSTDQPSAPLFDRNGHHPLYVKAKNPYDAVDMLDATCAIREGESG